jgi:hypothetical protein
MEFSEMKVIWDSQNQEPLYAMNETALRAIVQRRNQESERCLSRCFATEITVGVICGALMFLCAGALFVNGPAVLAALPRMRTAASGSDILTLMAAGGIWFYYSTYMYLARRRQKRRVETFDSSLRGNLERALSQTNFQIALARGIVWWGLVPVWLAGVLWVVTLVHLKAAPPAWANVLMAALLIGSLTTVVVRKQRSITNKFEPRKREFESLRAKLSDPQP